MGCLATKNNKYKSPNNS